MNKDGRQYISFCLIALGVVWGNYLRLALEAQIVLYVDLILNFPLEDFVLLTLFINSVNTTIDLWIFKINKVL